MLVSVITIVYNGVSELERTMQSVLNQDYPNIQYIVIDGGSSDGTLDLIKQFDEQIDTWLSEKDEGISDAFNKGIRYAEGELIGLLNCGDYFELDAISKMVDNYLQIGLHPNNYTVMHGNIRMFNEQQGKIYAPLKLETFSYQMPVWHPTIFASKYIYADFQYDKSYRIAMDYELFSKVYAAKGRFIYVNSLITHMNTKGLSNSNAAKGFKEVMHASRKNLRIHPLISYYYYKYRTTLNKLITLIKKNA